MLALAERALSQLEKERLRIPYACRRGPWKIVAAPADFPAVGSISGLRGTLLEK
jgi:hypothetical protein